ncbi:hypothetical protein E2C01_052634 [Portunus trituberculatus]|uniref:Uncharacterized protein n=1 Tax=Portunus trituberculatus TaxID=210409 RepID=A0A5B7GNS3_PORTR|nr:hypothetical protein [Portunus trituberculatus]
MPEKKKLEPAPYWRAGYSLSAERARPTLSRERGACVGGEGRKAVRRCVEDAALHVLKANSSIHPQNLQLRVESRRGCGCLSEHLPRRRDTVLLFRLSSPSAES